MWHFRLKRSFSSHFSNPVFPPSAFYFVSSTASCWKTTLDAGFLLPTHEDHPAGVSMRKCFLWRWVSVVGYEKQLSWAHFGNQLNLLRWPLPVTMTPYNQCSRNQKWDMTSFALRFFRLLSHVNPLQQDSRATSGLQTCPQLLSVPVPPLLFSPGLSLSTPEHFLIVSAF